jgi:hypothetical protein
LAIDKNRVPTFTLRDATGDNPEYYQFLATFETVDYYWNQDNALFVDIDACLKDGSLINGVRSNEFCAFGDKVLIVEQTCENYEPQIDDLYIQSGKNTVLNFGNLKD